MPPKRIQKSKRTTPYKKKEKKVKLLVDAREVSSIEILKEKGIECKYNKNLKYGDFNITVNDKIECIIERKHTDDVTSNFGQFKKEINEMIVNKFSNKTIISNFLIIEGEFQITPFNRETIIMIKKQLKNFYNKNFVCVEYTNNTEDTVKNIIEKFELYKEKGSISDITKDKIKNPVIIYKKGKTNLTHTILQSINGITPVTANNITLKYGSINNIIEIIKKDNDPKMFCGIFKSRNTRIGEKLSKIIFNLIKEEFVDK